MIFNYQLLFLHVPKTGGMSLTAHLLKVLPRPLYYSVPDGHYDATDRGIIHVPGYRHENLVEAKEVVARYGFDIARFPLILAAIRNPYALEVSRYSYLQKGRTWDAGHNQRLAMEADFETFAVNSFDHAHPIETYFELDGWIPPNLHVLRCEQLAEDLQDALEWVGLKGEKTLGRENESRHEAYECYYTRAAEEAVYQRYRWVFERGFYSRMDPGAIPFVRNTPECGPRLRLKGPVEQIGIPFGVWHDGWVGELLRLQICPVESIRGLVVEGRFPHAFPEGVEMKISLGNQTTRHRVCGTGIFRVETEVTLEPGARSIPVEVSVSSGFCPCEVGASTDSRRLSFLLDQITFLTSRCN
jgi:hypothetical protein